MPNPLWTILADPANRPMLALSLVGLVVIVFGPWALVKIAQRRAACGGVDAAKRKADLRPGAMLLQSW
jgi:hypothetical protein